MANERLPLGRLHGQDNSSLTNHQQGTVRDRRAFACVRTSEVLIGGSGPSRNLPLGDTFDPSQRWPKTAIRSFRKETGPSKTFGSTFGNLTGSFRQSHLLQDCVVPRIRVELIELRSHFDVLQPSPSLLDRDIKPVESVLCVT